MTRTRWTFALFTAALFAAPSCGPQLRQAHADTPKPAFTRPPPSGRTVDLEITDTPRGGTPRVARYTLALVDDTGWSELDAHGIADHVHLKARADGNRAPARIVSFEVERSEVGGPALHLTDSTVFFAGRRTVLGRLDRPDGSTTEVAVVTR